MPRALAKREERAGRSVIARPRPEVLFELGSAMWDAMQAFDRVFRSLGIPTAMSFVEEEPLELEMVEIACSSCEATTSIDERLAETTKFCSRCGSPLENEHATRPE